MSRRYDGYEKLFLEANEINDVDGYKNIINKLENYDKHIVQWEQEDLDNFIILTGSISENSINKSLQYVRDFYKFVCQLRGVIPKEFKLSKTDLTYYIDFDKLMRITISEEHFKILRNLLLFEIGNKTYNYRDSAILILAWEGLTNEEIKYLLDDDIEFFNEYNISKCKLHLKTRSVVIDDPDSIEIIKKVMIEQKYYVEESRNHPDGIFDLKDTPCFIRAAIVARKSNSITVANPSEILKSVFRRIQTISGTNIELSEMSLESVARSRKIDLLRKGVDTSYIMELFGKSTKSDLAWQSSIAILMERQAKKNK